jgi:Ca-activated chloride channel homolog
MVRPLAALCVLAVATAEAQAGELPRAIGMYQPSGTALALVDSKIEITVRGPIVEAVVTQRFQNRGDKPTEATYVFPLPYDAAVSAMSIEAGNKKIRAAVEKRESAQQRYEDAVRAGVAGALLDQERPDVFTQTVAAVPAKSTVTIALRFDTIARYQDGVWELALPLVVAPRYTPGVATNRPTTGTGRAPDTDRAPDASRVTPAGAPGAGGATEVVLKFADKPSDVTSPTHELKPHGGDYAFVDPKTDHDSIVRWKSGATAGGWVESGPDGGYAAVVVEAPAASRRGAVKCLLVLDRSAASKGDADAVAHPLVRGLFAAMTGNDRVAVAGSDQIAWGAPNDVARAVESAWQTTTAGAFDLTRVFERARSEGAPIVLVSGGLVSDDKSAIAAAQKLGVAIHVIGVGPAPARGLLSQLATATGGTLRFAIPGDDLTALAKATLVDLSTPPQPLTVNWGTLAASDVVPGSLPRLGAGQATLVLARVKQAQRANGRARGELFAIETLPGPRAVDGATTPMGPLARRWAKSRLDELLAQRAAPATVTAHALRYGLVSPYTSMVAIGDEVIVQGGVRRSVAVPVSVPAGMKWQQVKKQTTVDNNAIDARVTPDAKPGDKVAVKDANKTDKQNAQRPAKGKEGRDSVAKEDPKKQPPVKKPEQAPKRPKPIAQTERPTTPTGAGAPATQPPPPAQPGSIDTTGRAGDGDDRDDTKAAKRKKYADEEADVATKSDDDNDGAEDARHPSPAPLTARLESGADAELMGMSSSGGRKRWRLATSISGGLVRAGGESVSLLTAGARLELALAPRLLGGLEASAWLVDGDTVVGRTMVSFAVLGKRYLELGLGFGLQFGDGAGPAAGVSLRLHLPAKPRASLYLRYDGALINNNDARVGQNALTLGVEWAF